MHVGRNESLVAWLACVGLAVLAVAIVGIPARATYGARTSADEPQYLVTALSLAEDLDLDISDELSDRRFVPFHEIDLNPQTMPVDDAGRQFSPHDPLLPVLLAPAMAVGGWVAAKALLAVLAAATAMLTCWVAVRRLGVRPAIASIVTTGFFVGAPFAAYATQVYPELPAALVVLGVVACATATRLSARHLTVVVLGLTALPWLAVKYVPVAATLGLVALWPLVRDRRWRPLAAVGTALLSAGVIYLVVHQRIYGGWTVYASGDHFVDTGEFSVVGTNPDYLGRSRRLVGLLVDRRFGLVPWAPIWFLVPAAVAFIVARRPRGWLLVTAPLAAGWLTATYVALTMHGWWSPGRQVVVVAPLAVIAAAYLADHIRRLGVVAAVLGALGGVNWLWLAIESSTGRRTIIVDFYETAAWPYRWLAWAGAQGWPASGSAALVRGVWLCVFAVTAAVAWRSGRREFTAATPASPTSTDDVDDASPTVARAHHGT